jgi:glycogen(starch) synthase
MGVPSISTNLSGFGCFMEENIENCEDYGIYVTDRRMKSVEESLQQLSDQMFQFVQKTRRQRINQRNRTERLSDLLDWKRMGLEYIKARQLALRRAYPYSFIEDEQDEMTDSHIKIPKPLSAPASPKIKSHVNALLDDDEEDESFLYPALRRKSQTQSREQELLSEGDIEAFNKLALENKDSNEAGRLAL